MPESPPVGRLLTASLVVLIGGVGGVGWLGWTILAREAGLQPPSRVVRQWVGQAMGAPEPANPVECSSYLIPGGDVALSVSDPDGAPLSGIQLTLSEEADRTDDAGQLILTGMVQGLHPLQIEAPWAVIAPTLIRVAEDDLSIDVVVERRCPGPITALEPDGAPFSGRVKDPVGGWLDLTAGTATLPARLCGDSTLVFMEPRGTPGRAQATADVHVSGGESITVTLPGPGAAHVRTVNPDGDVVAGKVDGAQQTAEGWAVRGRAATRTITARYPGGFGVAAEIALDGGTTDVVITPDREVQVSLACDDCPASLSCGSRLEPDVKRTCTGRAPALACRCPAGEAWITAHTPYPLSDFAERIEVLAKVPADATAVVLDTRVPRGSIRGEWTGRLPCAVRLKTLGIAVPEHIPCDGAGAFQVEDLLPGRYTVTVGFGDTAAPLESAIRTAEVEPQQAIALGDIDPGTDGDDLLTP